MTLPEIANDIATVFGIPTYALAADFIKARILTDINAAIEQMQDSGEDFFGREDLAVNLVEGQEIYVLPKNIQTVIDPMRLSDGTILTQIRDHGALLHFAQIFQDQLSGTVAKAKPSHYFLESSRDTADVTGDNVELDLHIVPPPNALNAGTGKLLLHVIKEPSLVTASQLSAGTALLPVPHKYVESIFLPIARYNASGCSMFYDKEKKPQIDSDYQRALQIMGKADPRRPKQLDSNTNALEVRQQPQQPTQQ